jgi:predicted DNA-binding antitoxin AbrB/MazE fold protein
MRAIEATATFEKGLLTLDQAVNLKNKEKVKLIILVDEDDESEEEVWLDAVSKNPAFDFLKEPGEDIYTAEDGKPVHVK